MKLTYKFLCFCTFITVFNKLLKMATKMLRNQIDKNNRTSCFRVKTLRKSHNIQNYGLPNLVIGKLKMNERPKVNKTQTKRIPTHRIFQDQRERYEINNGQQASYWMKTPISNKNSVQIKRKQDLYDTDTSKYYRRSQLPPLKRSYPNIEQNSFKLFSSHAQKRTQEKKKKEKKRSGCKVILQRNCQFPFMRRHLTKPKCHKFQKCLLTSQLFDFQAKISKIGFRDDNQLFISQGSMKQILNI